MTRFILAIGCAIALVSTLNAQEPVPPTPPPLPPALPAAPLSPFAQKFEYEFVAKPRSTDAFKKLLKDRGKDGWEYAGLIPDGDELIFKRPVSGATLIAPPALPSGLAPPPAIRLPGKPAPKLAPPPPGLPGVPPIKDPAPPK